MNLFFKPKQKDIKMAVMINELNTVKAQLESAENLFNFTTDSDMIDSSIYKLEALNAKYRKLLKEIKSYRNSENKEAI